MKKELIFSFCFILLIAIVSANFEIGNLSHQITRTTYAQEENIQAWINLSFEKENSTSLFRGLGNENITLLELLNSDSSLKEGRDFICSSKNCGTNYIATNPETIKKFSLKAGQSKIIGIVFKQNLSSINSIEFNISSNAPPSCANQIEIDFLADGKADRINTKFSNNNCNSFKDYGCFNSSKSSTSYELGVSPKKHCEKIKLPVAPAFEIGANIIRNSYSGNITMGLYTLDLEEINNGTCNLPNRDGESSCLIKYPNFEPKDYLVCIYVDKKEDNMPEIRGYPESEDCGFYYNGDSGTKGAFEIFMEPRKFDSIGTIPIKNQINNGEKLSDKVQNYIMSKYNLELRCGENNCYVPIKINSKINQQINISDIKILYEELGRASQNKIYDLKEVPSTISSNYIKIYLDNANFSVGNSLGNKTFTLKLDDKKIFSEKILVKKIPKVTQIYPTTIAQGFPTQITAVLSSKLNNSLFKWYFGDGNYSETKTNKVTHTYKGLGNYTLKVSIGETKESSNSSFKITVVSPENAINQTLKKLQKDLEKIKNKIKDFDTTSKDIINNYLNLDNTEKNLSRIQQEFAQASTNAEYLNITKEIFSLKIPSRITKINEAKNMGYLVNPDYINLDALKSITGKDYNSEKEEDYKDAIISWNQEKINSHITYERYDLGEENFLNIFKLNLDANDLNGTAYLIIKNIENLGFKSNYSQQKIGDYYYIPLSSFPKNIVFYTSENVNFKDVPLFISPSFNSLSIIKNITPAESEKFKLTIFILAIFLLILIATGIYIFLQNWYKKKYEDYLFKNKTYLYNIATYINNEKKQGKEDKEIIKNLRKVGWNSEQINYAMKKYAGKRTGMYELPIQKVIKFIEKKKAPAPPVRGNLQRPYLPKRMQKKFFIKDDKFKRY